MNNTMQMELEIQNINISNSITMHEVSQMDCKQLDTGCSLNIVFFLNVVIFELCQICCSAVVLPAIQWSVYITLARVRKNFSKKNTIFNEHPVVKKIDRYAAPRRQALLGFVRQRAGWEGKRRDGLGGIRIGNSITIDLDIEINSISNSIKFNTIDKSIIQISRKLDLDLDLFNNMETLTGFLIFNVGMIKLLVKRQSRSAI